MFDNQVVMAGYVPILIEIDIEAMLWVDAEAMASFSTEILLSGKNEYTQSFLIDIDNKIASATGTSGKDSKPFGVDNIVVDGELAAAAALRVGPRVTISVEKVPLSLDIAARLGANAALEASKELDGTTCASGSLELNGGLDVRASIDFPSLDPGEFAHEVCMAGVSYLVKKMDPINTAVDKAQCYTDLLGINTSEVDEKQGEINNALDDAADNICADVGKNLSSDENEEFSQQIDAPPLSTEWASIIEATLVNVEKGLCNSVEVVALEREDDVYTELGSMEAPQSVGDVRKTEYSLLFVYLVCSLISLFFLL